MSISVHMNLGFHIYTKDEFTESDIGVAKSILDKFLDKFIDKFIYMHSRRDKFFGVMAECPPSYKLPLPEAVS